MFEKSAAEFSLNMHVVFSLLPQAKSFLCCVYSASQHECQHMFEAVVEAVLSVCNGSGGSRDEAVPTT